MAASASASSFLLRCACLLVLAVGAGAACDRADSPASDASAVDAPRAPMEGEAVIPGAIVVDFKDGIAKDQVDQWEGAWGVDLEFNSDFGTRTGITLAVGVADVASVLEQIRAHPAVEAAEPQVRYSATMVPNDPDYARQWNLKMIDAEAAWETSTGKGVIVAVLDTGIAYENVGDFILVPDLDGAKLVKGYDFVNDDDGAHDDHGHGTHVAGTLAQVTNNAMGVAGVAFDATLMPVKVLDHFGHGTSADIADAIRWATDHGAKVINLSLGGGLPSAVLRNAVAYARSKGVTVVCAAGNASRGRVEYPAAFPEAVAVSAVGPDGMLAPYSSWGRELDLAAPGGNKALGETSGILQNTLDRSDYTRSVYAWYQGTSMATPHVAGVAALLYAAGATGPDEVEQALFAGARRAQGQTGWNDRLGHGILNAQGALAALGASPPSSVDWRAFVTALVMLAVVLLTLRRRERPGYLNILIRPLFLVPLLLATVGAFVVRYFTGAGASDSEVLQLAQLPIPDWQRIIFGRGKLANPLFYSALIPLVLSLIAIKARGLRPVIAGLSLGFGAFLGYAIFARAPGLAYLPFSWLAVPWLVVNAIVCLVITRAMLKKERAT